MKRNRLLLMGLLAFNGITASVGGLALMNGSIKPEPEWFTHTSFTSGYIPGLILFAVVGGSSLLAAIANYHRVVGDILASILAGLIMVFWIVGEVVSIHTFHVLQVIYFLTGMAVLVLAIRRSRHGPKYEY